MEELSKKQKGLMDMDNNVVIAGGGGIRELNGKNTISLYFECNDHTVHMSLNGIYCPH